MIIVHSYHSYFPNIGGMEIVVKRITEEQARLGHEIHVVTAESGARMKRKDEYVNDVFIHRINGLNLGYPDMTLPLKIPKHVLKVIKNADIVHIHSHNSLFNIKIAEIAKKHGVKIAIHFMAIDSLSTHPNLFKRVLGTRYQDVITKRALKLADIKIVKSLRDKILLKKKFNSNSIYIPDGIDDYYFSIPQNKYKFRKKFDITDEEDLYLYIGRLSFPKGPHILLKAARYLQKINRKFRIVFIGPGPKNWLIKLAKKLDIHKKVIFTGILSEELKISAIDSSECVVIPSLYDYVEVFSLVTSEAWARRKPVVASSVGELKYRIHYGRDGLLVPPNNPIALAKVLAIVKDYNFNIEKKLYTWHEISEKILYLYKKYV